MITALPIWQLVIGFLGSLGLGGMFKAWLDHLRGKRKATDEVALALVGKLESRIDKLEGDQKEERDRCDAMLATLRHSRNNSRTIIYSLLHLFDMPAAKRKDALAAVREQISAMEAAEAHEGAIIRAAPLSVREARAEWGSENLT